VVRTYRVKNMPLVRIVAITACFVSGIVAAEKIPVPLFLFSGQSNMVGLGAAASTAEQKKIVENVKIDCRADNNTKKWTTLGPGFGADATHFGVELFFGKVLSDSMPGVKFAFIKNARSGTYLGKATEWLPPSSNNGTNGKFYDEMMKHIDDALKRFNEAYDTSKYVPKWAGFIWHQGEFDGWNDKALADKYETNLTNLIKDIRTKTNADSLPILIPMIAGSMWQYKSIVQAADVAVAKKTVNADTMSTEGLTFATDNIHYNNTSMEKIGMVSGQKWLKMKYSEKWFSTPVVHQVPPTFMNATPAVVNLSTIAIVDLAGRKVNTLSMHSASPRQTATMMLVKPAISKAGEMRSTKELSVR